ncbi:MAG: aminopeptidase P family protein [Thermoplasmata archaeon]
MRFMIEDILKKVDAILIYNQGEPMVDLNFFYFSRLLESGLFEGSYILIDNDKRVIITSELEETSAKKSDFQIEIFRKNQEKYELLSKYLGGKKKIGISFSSISLKEFNNLRDKFNELEFVDIENELSGLRQIKNDFEISLIKEAGKIASDVAEEIINYIKEGITENELAAKLTYLIMKNGAQDNAFTPIIAFGENSAEPHYFPGKRKLRKNDFVLLDFGAKFKKYNSDITRTYIFGKASEKQKRIYEIVREAQELGIESIMEGKTGKEVDTVVRNFIDSTEFKGLFIHSTGHGVGLAVHDHPALSQSSELLLKEGMVVTVEPGIYVKGFGGVRIEDDVLVKKNGRELLTSAPKEMIEI